MVMRRFEVFDRPRLGAAIALLLLVSASAASAQTVQRPLYDFVEPNLSGNYWLWNEPGEPAYVYLDYFGRFNAENNLNLGTTIDGMITERELRDGRALVRVVFHVSQAFVVAYDSTRPGPVEDRLLFGHMPGQIQAGEEPGLGEIMLKVEFINTEPGVPLPSLVELFDPPARVELQKILVVATAEGPLSELMGVPDGTPGMLQTTQRGLIDVHGIIKDGDDDVDPAEHVNIWAVGHRRQHPSAGRSRRTADRSSARRRATGRSTSPPG